MSRTDHPRPADDPYRVRAVQERRRSNAATAIPTRKTRRQSTRANQRGAAIREFS